MGLISHLKLNSKRNHNNNEHLLSFFGMHINLPDNNKKSFRFKKGVWSQNSPFHSSAMENQNHFGKSTFLSTHTPTREQQCLTFYTIEKGYLFTKMHSVK